METVLSKLSDVIVCLTSPEKFLHGDRTVMSVLNPLAMLTDHSAPTVCESHVNSASALQRVCIVPT